MTGASDGPGGLRPAERGRLDRFASLFERLDASQYATLTDSGDDPDVEAAQAEALRLVGRSGSRHDAVRSAIKAFTDAATVAYAQRMSLPDTLLLFQSLPDRATDRYRFLGSVERAVVALILWDELGEDDREVLAGPWSTLLQQIIDG